MRERYSFATLHIRKLSGDRCLLLLFLQGLFILITGCIAEQKVGLSFYQGFNDHTLCVNMPIGFTELK